ncbi:hypothetical protein FG379_002007 [Cryptosporidium bovis]|uniref:uncharacterized protein n=1 Tax=Cryptosporidium bovis TaxID=310047 RepID=UPI00351A6BB7|nr:hypothetical protein FG379_002007 [Cryptosporidium bovis]
MVRDTRLYDIIGVDPDATTSEIKREYRIRALLLHPDKNNNDEVSKERFQELQNAYEILRNDESRKTYDETGIIEGEEENTNFNNIVEFFTSFSRRITEEDIENYKRNYRGSEEEWEDLSSFYHRFNGSCKHLLEYIPFAEPDDIEYYLNLIETAIRDGRLPSRAEFDTSKKYLERKAKKYKKSKKYKSKEQEEEDVNKLIRELRERSRRRIEIISQIIAKHEHGYPKDMDEEVYETLYAEMIKDGKRFRR